MCATVDGWALQYYAMRPYNAPSQYYKQVIRYRNNGKFIISVFDTGAAYQSAIGTNTIQGYMGTNYWAFVTAQVITGSNPTSGFAVVIEPMAGCALSGSEQPYP
jgi:hypothetical protein